MSLHKAFKVVRSDNKENVLEEFASIEAAEKFMILMQSKGESVRVITDEDDVPEDTPDEYNIEGLEIDEPTVEFGSDLDTFLDEDDLLSEDEDPGITFD